MSTTDSTKKRGLGKGFESLIPVDFDQSILLSDSDKIQKIRISLVKANREQPRTDFNEEDHKELMASVKRHGILQPLILTPIEGGKYMIVAGERRYRAAKGIGLETIPAIVRSMKELERLEIALVENVQRVDLSPLEQALSIERLNQQFNMTYAVIAERLGKATATVGNIVRLLQLPKDAREALRDQKITEGHARAILALKGMPDKQKALLENIQRLGWSVRQAEQFAVGSKSGHKTEDSIKQHMTTKTAETKELSKLVSAPVSIRRTAKGGKLEFGFNSDEDLSRLINKLLNK